KSIRWEPFRHRLRIKKCTLDFFRCGTQHAVNLYRVRHNSFPFDSLNVQCKWLRAYPMTPNETWESDNSQNTLIGSENCSAATSASSCRAHQQIGYSSDHSPRSLHRVAEGSAYRRQRWGDMR